MSFQDDFKRALDAMNVILPEGKTPLPAKLIALITSVGGLSILANALTDIITPEYVSPVFYLMRLTTGFAMMAVGYGIIKHKGWTIWVYGCITLVALVLNPILAILPGVIVLYLASLKFYFDKSFPRRFMLYIKQILAESYARE